MRPDEWYLLLKYNITAPPKEERKMLRLRIN